MRFILDAFAGVVGFVVSWCVVGFIAAEVLTAIEGPREGSAAMGGFFVIGPIGGILGFALALFLAHRYLAPTARTFLVVLLVSGIIVVGGGALVWFLDL